MQVKRGSSLVFRVSRFALKPTKDLAVLMPVEAENRNPALILNGVRELIRKYRWSFLLATIAGIGLRLLFIYKFPNINGDSLIYADIASNWMHHGTFALTEMGVPVPTLIRLPGYPAFLAAIFYLFRSSSMTPVLIAQLLVDLGTCFIVAALALELYSAQVARAAFVLAALCPFTANYVGLPLTETLSIFFTALALLLAAKAVRGMEGRNPSFKFWMGCAMAVGAGILMRPDGALLLIAIVAYLAWRFLKSSDRKQYLVAALIVCSVSAAPLVPWTVRNWKVFHVVQPLAPRYANAPTEYVASGFNRWTKTWMAEYVSVEDVYWKVSTETPGESIDPAKLPSRAFDSAQEREWTAELIAELNRTQMLDADADAKFAELARERIRRSPLRYYVWLPTLRIADMWLRPRTEMLPIEPRWWTFDDEQESWIAIAYGGLNLLLVAMAVMGFAKFRNVRIYGLLLGFVLLRSLFLSSIENPEPRYTLECFPVILVMAAAALQSGWERIARSRAEA
jgi:4-amino-4-deoxy-L-arabinose transferase-like glycosyltransferase